MVGSCVIGALLLRAATNDLHAATYTWTGATNNNWNSATNWSPAAVPAPVAGDIIDVSTLDLTAAKVLNLNNGTQNNNRTAGTWIFGDTNAGGGSTFGWTVNSGGTTNPKLILATSSGNGTIQVNNGTTTIAAPIDGTVGLAKTGAGTLSLTSTLNSFTGGIFLDAGGLSFSSGTLNNNLITTGGSSTLTWTAHTTDISNLIKLGDGFALTLGLSTNSADTTTFASTLQTGTLGTGSIIKSNASTLVITAAQNYTGGTTLNNGRTILSGGDNRLATGGAVVVGSGSNITALQLGDATAKSDQTVSRITVGAGTSSNYSVVGGNSANSTLTINNTLASVPPVLGGSGTNENNLTLVKSGSGTLSLAQINTFTGNVTIQGGAVTATNGSALGLGNKTITILGTVNAPGLKLNDTGAGFGLGANLSLVTGNDNNTTPAIENVLGNNVISGTIALASGGFGTGGTRIRSTGGSLTLNGNIAPLTTTAGSVTLTLDGAANGAANGLLSDNGTRVLGLTKAGTGAWSLAAANTYTGPTQISAGRLNITTAQTGGGAITVADAASLGVTIAAAGQTLNTSALSLGATTGGTSLFLNLGSAGNPTAPVITAPAFSTASAGTSAVNVSATGLTVGQFALVSYTGSIGGGGYSGLVLGTLPARVSASLVNNTSAHSVDLNVTAFDLPKWTGQTSNVWDFDPDGTGTTGTQNWREVTSGNVARYLQGTGGTDSVRFDDTAGVPTNVTLGGTLTPASITVNTSANAFTFSGTGKISGTTTLTKQGSTTLVFANTGTNDYTGQTTISGGALQIGDGVTTAAGQLGSGDVVNNGSLIFNRPDDLTAANIISGSGSITKQGVGVLTLSGNNGAFTGGITVSAGTLKVGSPNALGSAAGNTVVNAGATLEITGIALASEPVSVNGGTLSSVSGTSSLGGAVTINAGATVNVTAGTATLSGAIGGSGGLAKTGAGTLVFSGSSSFAGGLNVTAGNATLSATQSFSDGLTVNTTGGTVTLSANQSYTGGTTISQGTLQLGATANSTAGNVGSGVINLNPGAGQTAILSILRGDNSLNISNTITSSGAGTSSISVGSGTATSLSGTVTLSGNNTFTGDVSIVGGALKITNSNALGLGPKTINIQNASRPALILDGTSGDITLASNLSYNLGSDGTILTTVAQNAGGIINIAGNNTINGAIALTNGGGGNGKVVVNGGSLTLTGTVDATGATGAKTLLLGGSATGTVSGVVADWFDTVNSANRVVSVTKDGTGAWTLSNNNTFTGTTTISEGALKIASITTGGTAQPLGQATSAILIGAATTNGVLEYTGTTAATLDRPLTVNGAGGGTLKNSGGALLTVSNTLTSTGRSLTLSGGSFQVSGLIAGTAANSALIIDNATVALTNAANSYNGSTTVQNGGKLVLAADYLGLLPASVSATNVKLNNGTLKAIASFALSANRGVAIGPTGAGSFEVDSGATLTVNGIIADNGGAGGSNKTGLGTLLLTNANTLSGDVNIYAGTLRINNATGSATGSGNLIVALGSALQGSGFIVAGLDKSITLNGGLQIGDPAVNSAKTLSLATSGAGSTTIGAASVLSFDVFSGAGSGVLSLTDADLLSLTGSLSISSGATIKLGNPNNITAWAANDQFQIFDWTALTTRSGTFNFDVSDWNLPSNLTLNTSSFYTTGIVSLSALAIPEPNRAMLVVFGITIPLLRRRRPSL